MPLYELSYQNTIEASSPEEAKKIFLNLLDENSIEVQEINDIRIPVTDWKELCQGRLDNDVCRMDEPCETPCDEVRKLAEDLQSIIDSKK